MKIKNKEDRKKTLSFSIDPRIYDLWVKYCKENAIENYSEFIEKIMKEKIKDIK